MHCLIHSCMDGLWMKQLTRECKNKWTDISMNVWTNVTNRWINNEWMDEWRSKRTRWLRNMWKSRIWMKWRSYWVLSMCEWMNRYHDERMISGWMKIKKRSKWTNERRRERRETCQWTGPRIKEWQQVKMGRWMDGRTDLDGILDKIEKRFDPFPPADHQNEPEPWEWLRSRQRREPVQSAEEVRELLGHHGEH